MTSGSGITIQRECPSDSFLGPGTQELAPGADDEWVQRIVIKIEMEQGVLLPSYSGLTYLTLERECPWLRGSDCDLQKLLSVWFSVQLPERISLKVSASR